MKFSFCAISGAGERKSKEKRIDNFTDKKYNKAMTDRTKTIVAVATPPGRGAIGIVRISGPDTLRALTALFPHAKKNFEPRRFTRAKLDAFGWKDDCAAVFFRGPESYTGEDSAELYLHGSPALMSGVVDCLVGECGLSYAEGGDFTARALANGKMDLTAAEGVADIVNAESKAQIGGAYSLIAGELRGRIEELQRAVVRVRAGTEAAIDYPEEDVEEQTRAQLKAEIGRLTADVDALLGTYRSGRLRENGVRVALIGRPNAGKSSLLNALLGYDRAIVTPEEGTTRDVVEGVYVYGGVKFTVTDTAGLREAQSLPEKLGLERARIAAREADVVAVVTVAGHADDELIARAEELRGEGKAVIVVENKIDLFSPGGGFPVCATGGEGVEELRKKIFELADAGNADGGAALVNARQFSAVSEARAALARAGESVTERAAELVSSDLYDAYSALGKVTGITGSDAVVAEIFSRFCVGK